MEFIPLQRDRSDGWGCISNKNVIPAQAGIQFVGRMSTRLWSRFLFGGLALDYYM